jgi:hypothetical protein
MNGSAARRTQVSNGDGEHVHMTSKLIVAQAYAWGCGRVVYNVTPQGDITVVDPLTGHARCEFAYVEGTIDTHSQVPLEELWNSVASCRWPDGSRMYTADGYPAAPEGEELHPKLKGRRHLLPGQIKMHLDLDKS